MSNRNDENDVIDTPELVAEGLRSKILTNNSYSGANGVWYSLN